MIVEPKEVSDVLFAFPANVVGDYLPNEDELPEEFGPNAWIHNPCCDLASGIFYGRMTHKGESIKVAGEKIGFTPREGVDPMMAWRHILACLKSYEPKHQHKIAGVGYLISMWIDSFLVEGEVVWENPISKEQE